MSLVLRQLRCLLLVIAASLGLSAAEGTGTGLLATYYANETLSGSPAVSRTDAQVNFAWSGGAPAVGMPVDSFSVCWEGEIEARFTENLTLIARTDDGVRLWLDNQLVIDAWVLRGAVDSSYTFAAQAGRKYRIRMEYYEHFGSAVAQLHWQGASIARAAIPSAYLYPTLAVELSSGTGTGLLSRYYGNESLSGNPVLARTDARVDFGWGGGSPDVSVPVDSFSARWDGEIEPRVVEPLTLIARTDDGVRMWIDGQLVIDSWVLRSAADSTYTFTPEAGRRYRIRLEYFEHTGSAVARLYWQSATELKAPIPTSQLYPTDPVDPPNGTGTGLLASYYANEWLAGPAVVARTDARVDFDWKGGSPGAGIPADSFSARWLGEIESRTTGPLTLIARTDDGVRMWIDDQLVIDQWVLRGAADSIYTFSSVAGQHYRIRLEYFERTGAAVARLWWQSAYEPKSPIPTSQLYPVEPPMPPAGTGTGLSASYFANESLSGPPALTRLDQRVDFSWGGGSPDASIPVDSFSARWEGEIQPRVSGSLTLIARTDDGVRLWLDDVQIINAWILRGAADSTYTFQAEAGRRYRIRMEYFEHTGSAVAKLWWQGSNEPKGPVPTSQLYPSPLIPLFPGIAFSSAASTVNEDAGTTTLTVSLSGPTAWPVTVSLISSNTADAQVPSSVTIPAGSTSVSVPVTVIDDPRYGPDRQVTIALADPTGGVLNDVSTHVLTLRNTDPPPTVSLAQATSMNLENSGTASVIVRLSAVYSVPKKFGIILSGTATPGVDYTDPGISFVIPADTLEGTIFLSLLPDTIPEPDETIVITLVDQVDATLGAITTHTVTISDGNQTPIIVTGPTPAANPVSGTSVELSLMVSDDGAPADLTTTWSVVGAPAGSVTFAPSTGTGFTVSTAATANAFGTYIIQATTRDAYQATVSAQTTVTFVAPKQSQSITFTALPSKTYGDAPFALTATASSGLPVSYSSSDTSVATISGNTVTIVGAGSTSITATQEGNASWEAAASVAQVLTVAKATQTITFAPLPSVTYGDAPLTLSATASSGLPVSFSSSDTAVATISGSTLTIVGVGSATITASQDGNANVAAATPVERLLSVAPATSVTIAATTPETSQGQPEVPGILTVTRTGDLTSPLTVSYTVGGTAVPGVAYASLSGQVVIPASASAATIAVVPVAPEDGVANPDVTVSVTVVPTATYTVGPLASATVTIHDPNSLDATIAIDQATRFQTIEGIGGNFANGRFDGSDQPNDAVGAVALAELAPSHARVGIPLKGWVPSAANLTQNDAFAAYQDSGRVRNVFLLMQDLAQRGIPVVASVWDAPNWMVANPSATTQRQLAAGMHEQLAAAIAAFVSHAHDQYGVTIAAVSFNESNHGYHLLLSAAEYTAIVRSTAERLQAKGLATRWLAGETTGVASLLTYATPVVTDLSTRPWLAAIGEHTWDTLLIGDPVFANVANFAQANGLPVWATEVGYDAQLHTQSSNPFPTWEHARQLALVTQRSMTVGRAAVVHLWSYQNDYPLADALTGELYPAGQVMKQLTDSLHPGATLVAASPSLSQLAPLAAVNDQRNEFTAQVINNGATPLCVAISGVPDRQLTVISSTSAQQRRTLPALDPENGRVVLVLPAQSITTLSGSLHDGPANQVPVVEAGADQSIAISLPLTLSGVIQDDGLPSGSTLSATWSLVSGPGSIVFADANQPITTATVDASGVYLLRLSASDGALTGSDLLRVSVLGSTLHVNFQSESAAVPHGYLPDSGASFADRGNGFSYGWNAVTTTSVDRDSPLSLDQRYDTSIGMQQAANADASWQIAVPNGDYDVHVVAGDATETSGTFRILVGGTLAISGSPSASQRWLEATVRVHVSTGRLVVSNGEGAVNNKLCFIDITPVPVVVPTVAFAQAAVSVPETAGMVAIPVQLSAATTQETAVAYTVTGGTAIAGTHYQGPVFGTLTIAAGQTSAFIPVSVLADQRYDADKTLTLSLSAPTNATLGTPTSTTLTITNTNALPVVAFSSSTLSVDQQAGSLSIPLTLAPASGLPSQVEVAVASAGSTAVAGTDYAFIPGTVGFAPGATSGTIPLGILASGSATDQTVVLTLTTVDGAAIGAGATMTITIRGTASVPTVAFQSGEGQGFDAVENVSVPVVLAFAAAHDVTVAYTATGVSAINGPVSDPTADFTLPDGTLTIPAGQTSGAIAFTVVNRTIPESSKVLTITLSAPNGATLGTPSTFTYTIRNDNLPAPVVTYSVGTASGVDLFGMVPPGYGITTLLVSAPSEFTTVSGTVSSSGVFHAHVGNITPGATSVTCELAFGDAASHQGPPTTQTVAFGDGSGGSVTTGDPSGLPPATPTVTITITQGLTGQQTGDLNGEAVSFTKNNQVTVSVTATTSLGTITAIEVVSSDGQALDATGGPVILLTPTEGSIEITATATATQNDQTASGSTEDPTILIVDRTKPALTYTMPKRYWPASYDQNAVPPPVVLLRQSLTQDRDLVLLNGNDEAKNKPLREQRGMNVFDAGGFTVEAIVSDESGLRTDVPHSATAVAQAATPLTVEVRDPQDPESGDPQTVVISGLAALDDSAEYDAETLWRSEGRGRYKLHVVIEDRAGNTLDADAFKLWVKRQPPVLGAGIMFYQDGKITEVANSWWGEITAMDSMRWVVATNDTAEVWQDQIDEAHRLPRLLPDADVPSDSYQGPSGWRLRTPVPMPGRQSGTATVIARDWVGNTSQPVTVTLDRHVLDTGGWSDDYDWETETSSLFDPYGYGALLIEQPVVSTTDGKHQDSFRFKWGDWGNDFEQSLLSPEGVREAWATFGYINEDDPASGFELKSVHVRDATDARAKWSWLVVNPLDPGADGDTRHATPVVLTIPPSWKATPPPVRVVVRDRGIAAVRSAGLGYSNIILDVLRPGSPLYTTATTASAGPGTDSLQADIDLKRTDADPNAVLLLSGEEPPRVPASNPGLTRVSYEAWPASGTADESTRPVTEYAAYTSQTGFRWFNLIKLSPDVIATGTRVTIRIEAGFLDDSFRLTDFDPEGDYVHFRSGSNDLTLTAADYDEAADPAMRAGKIAIAGQRLIVEGVNSSLVQTLELDLDIAADVVASLFDVDVKLGAVKAYSDSLSAEHAGENGAHRMKEALAICRVQVNPIELWQLEDKEYTIRVAGKESAGTQPSEGGNVWIDVALPQLTDEEAKQEVESWTFAEDLVPHVYICETGTGSFKKLAIGDILKQTTVRVLGGKVHETAEEVLLGGEQGVFYIALSGGHLVDFGVNEVVGAAIIKKRKFEIEIRDDERFRKAPWGSPSLYGNSATIRWLAADNGPSFTLQPANQAKTGQNEQQTFELKLDSASTGEDAPATLEHWSDQSTFIVAGQRPGVTYVQVRPVLADTVESEDPILEIPIVVELPQVAQPGVYQLDAARTNASLRATYVQSGATGDLTQHRTPEQPDMVNGRLINHDDRWRLPNAYKWIVGTTGSGGFDVRSWSDSTESTKDLDSLFDLCMHQLGQMVPTGQGTANKPWHAPLTEDGSLFEDPISTSDNSAMYTLSMDQIRKIWLWNDSGLMSNSDESIRKRLSAETMPQELWQRARDKVQYSGDTPTYVQRTDETSRREKQLLEAKVRWISDQATLARLKRYFSLRLLDARRPVSEWVRSVDPKNPGEGLYSDPRGYVYDPLPTMGHDAMVGQFVWAFSGPLTSLMNTDLTPGWHVGHPFTEDLLRWMIMERLTAACAIVKEWESQGLGVDQPNWPIVIGNARSLPLEFSIDTNSGLGLFRVRAQDALYDADPDLLGNIGHYQVLSWEDGRDALGAKMETTDGRRHLYLKVRNRDSTQVTWIPVYGRTPEAGLAIRLVQEAEYLSVCLAGRDQEAFWNTAWNDSPVWLMAYAVGDFLVGASSIHALVTGYDFRNGESLTGGQYAVNAAIAALNLIPGVATITRRAVVAVRSGAAADLARSLLSRNLNLAPQAVRNQLSNVVESMANGGRQMAASAKQLAVGTRYLLASAEVKGLNVTARRAAEDLATWFLSHCGAARMGDSLLAKTGSQAPVMNPYLVLKDAAKRPVPDAALVRETMPTKVDDAVAASNDLARAQKVMDVKEGTHGATGAAATTEKLMAKGGCFPAGTPVLMADGTYKSIEHIVTGDRVASRDEHHAAGDMMPGLVSKVMVRSKESVIHLHLHRNGDDLLVKPTEEHPFWVHGRGWTHAGDIMVGDILRGDVGEWTVVSASKVLLGRIIPVYNFTVSDLHSYFVGSISPNGPPKWVWVHNTSKVAWSSEKAVVNMNRAADLRIPKDKHVDATLAVSESVSGKPLLTSSGDKAVSVREYIFSISPVYRQRIVNGKKTYQRDDLFDPNAVTAKVYTVGNVEVRESKRNVEWMRDGKAPVGPDGLEVNLHHIEQTKTGALAEIAGSKHRTLSSLLHDNVGQSKSLVRGGGDSSFDAERRAYWLTRAKDFE